ncbi:hypothetical protein ES705_24372 [subsurface metagenome]
MRKSLTFWDILPPSLITVGVLLLIGHLLIKSRRPEVVEIIDDGSTTADEIPDEPAITQEKNVTIHYKVIRDALPASVPDDTAKILTAHAMHETGVFKSRLYREQNNLFGMRHPTIRDTLSRGDVDGFADFKTLEDSVLDLLLYFKEFGLKPVWKQPDTFVKAIKSKGYFEESYIPYVMAVKKHYAKVKMLIQ